MLGEHPPFLFFALFRRGMAQTSLALLSLNENVLFHYDFTWGVVVKYDRLKTFLCL